jgi:hypothetical protein
MLFGRGRGLARLPAMRTILAGISFLICICFYSFIVAGIHEGITSWGLRETIETLTYWVNLLLLTAYVLLGTFFLRIGIRLWRRRASA